MLRKILPLAIGALAITTGPTFAQSSSIEQANATNNPETLYLLGQKELARFQFDTAIAIFKKAIRNSPSQRYTSLARLSLFTTYKVAGVSKVDTFPREAIPMLKAAIELEPKDAFLYSRLGDAYCHKEIRDYTTCLHYYSERIRVHPDKGLGYFSRGVVRLNRIEDKSSAYTDFRQAISAALTAGDEVGAQRYLNYARQAGMSVPRALR
jgi:tetratricopeptide (TPR) repeat protein